MLIKRNCTNTRAMIYIDSEEERALFDLVFKRALNTLEPTPQVLLDAHELLKSPLRPDAPKPASRYGAAQIHIEMRPVEGPLEHAARQDDLPAKMVTADGFSHHPNPAVAAAPMPAVFRWLRKLGVTYLPPITHPCSACGAPAKYRFFSKCQDAINRGDGS